jgi:hypothetical protein
MMGKRKPLALPHTKFQSALTTGRDILANIDGRTSAARRYRDLAALYAGDLGGEQAGLSEGQLALVRRAAALTVELERMETLFAKNDGATPRQLETYQRSTNTLRRLIESLGIHRGRVAKDVTPPSLSEYLASKARTIDNEDDAEVD